MARPTLISLFTGAGGLDVGLEAAGFRTVAANDHDADAMRTLWASQALEIPIPGSRRRVFLGGTKLIEGPIETIESEEFQPRRAASSWVPDLLAGGPPCQPFSSSGKQNGLNDPRGELFVEFARVAADLRPKLILFENVRGLVTQRGPLGTPGEVLLLIKETFEAIGYATRFGLLNAADYGSPQRRVRLMMIGSRISTLPDFPAPTHSADAQLGLKPWVTLGDFISEFGTPPEEEWIVPTATLEEQLRDVPMGSGLKSMGSREATRPGGHWGYRQGTFIADQRLPARTVTASTAQDWIRTSGGRLRRVSPAEAAGLQGFPRNWSFEGSIASRYRQAGNAVPIPLASAVGIVLARAVRRKHIDSPVESAPLPSAFQSAIRYTEREESRNGPSRRRVKALQAKGRDVSELKGLGAAG